MRYHAAFTFFSVLHAVVCAAWFILCWVGDLQPSLSQANRLGATYAGLLLFLLLPRIKHNIRFAAWAIGVCDTIALVNAVIYLSWLVTMRTADPANYASALARNQIPLIWATGLNNTIAWTALSLLSITAAVHVVTVVSLLVICVRETPEDAM